MIALLSYRARRFGAELRLGHRRCSSCGVIGLARIVVALFGLEHNMNSKPDKTSEPKTDVGVRRGCRLCMVHRLSLCTGR